MPERFDQARLGATLRACRVLRHELATPLAAAGLHLELARRAAERVEGGIHGTLRSALETCRQKLDETPQLLDGLTALGRARTGEPGSVNFAAVVRNAIRDTRPELERMGLSVCIDEAAEDVYVDGFADELETAAREALLEAARRASAGEAHLSTRARDGTASFVFRVPSDGRTPGNDLFKTQSGKGAGLGPFLARWTFEAHGGRLDGAEDGSDVVVTASLPQVSR